MSAEREAEIRALIEVRDDGLVIATDSVFTITPGVLYEALAMLAAARRECAVKDEALRTLRDGYDDHEPTCAMFLPQKECDCPVGLFDAALTPEEPTR